MQEFLDNLEALHTSSLMINHTRAIGGLVRKEPVTTSHPLVRVHPVTSKKSLFVNNEFITRISNLKEAESRVLIDFLVQHMIGGHDFQARVQWKPRTIVLFDNRSTIRKLFFFLFKIYLGPQEFKCLDIDTFSGNRYCCC